MIKQIAILFIFCSCSFTLSAQFEKVWEKDITVHHPLQNIDDWLKDGGHLIYNVGWWIDTLEERKHHQVLSVLDSLGSEIWRFNWSTQFNDQFTIRLNEDISDNKIIFTADHQKRDSVDFVGVIELFEGIKWLHSTSGELIDHSNMTNSMAFLTVLDSISTVTNIDYEGNVLWNNQIVKNRTSNQFLTSNHADRLIWLLFRKLYLLNANGQIIAIDSSMNWSPYYSVINMEEDAIDICEWSSLQFSLRRNTNLFDIDVQSDLPYINNSFVPPLVLIDSDSAAQTYLASTDVPGISPSIPFLTKYDQDLNQIWTHQPSTQIKRFHNFDNCLIYVISKSVNQIDPITGVETWQYLFEEGEVLTNSLFDSKKNEFYISTKSNDSAQITKFSKSNAVGTNKINTDHVIIYPNPVGNILHITGASLAEKLIFNAQGQLVLRMINDKSNINVSSLAKGVYFLVVRDERTDHSTSTKFIKT